MSKEQKVVDKKSTRDEKDLIAVDQNGRNILHRAALEQQLKLIQDLISDYTQIIEDQVPQDIDKKAQQDYIQQKLDQFINSLDKFKNNPLLCACFKQKQQAADEKRVKLIQLLIENGVCILIQANPYQQNPRTLWTLVFWLAHNGDTETIQYLISLRETHKIKVLFCKPDFQGYYPIG